MKKLSVLLFLYTSFICYAQEKNLTCLDFNRGEFRNISENSNLSSLIVRNGNKQLEVTNGVESFKRIEWLNDCDYILFFSNRDAKKDSFKRFINKNGGIKVKTVKIEKNILYYNTYYFDGKKEIMGEGRLLKTSNHASFK
ncbi:MULTISPECIES: hypothetical protein [Apibacter]|uniref:hypothetical protein n=1 Tax=Apibacter TaxID=1778601 RepID=UPI000CF8B944|nr:MULTISPECIES: hypothetical protein [Apibacter]MCX8676367.1 hypothetical protein [Apibacter sp. B3919]MXO23831.1 hypothetical protein [Apibacter sp. B3924]MXO26491.1 hypothetical protein [Apibacter sp. B3813]MXO28443.1 hypothetical protein [Apibacter sp. B3913]MXO30397.1 hypothetical protein [Apibacter sp. B3912]